jgi:hypothetical protein
MKSKNMLKYKYMNGQVILVDIVEAPKEAKADVVRVTIIKPKDDSYSYYFTPDEAMTVAAGLAHAVNFVMQDRFALFRSLMKRGKI